MLMPAGGIPGTDLKFPECPRFGASDYADSDLKRAYCIRDEEN